MRKPGFVLTKQCDECPWRKDVPAGKFPPERYAALEKTCEQGFNPIFACHKTPDEAPQACVGFLMVDGVMNFSVRVAALNGKFDVSKLEASGPLYESFADMARANGWWTKKKRG